MRIIWTE